MIFSSEGFIDALCSAIANGGSPIDFCDEHKLRFDDLIAWLSEKNLRLDRYNSALKARDEWLIQRIMLELKRIAVVDIRDVFDDNGNLKDIKKLSPELASCVQSIETFEEFQGEGKDREFIGYTKKIKFYLNLTSILIGEKWSG